MTAGRKSISNNKNWGTPSIYVNAVKRMFDGNIGLDPCSNIYSIVNADVEYILPENDGLTESWDFPTIYVNPPYGKDVEHNSSIKQWLEQCADAHEKYGSEVIALIPVATNTRHWKYYIWGVATGVCFLYDTRLKFLIEGEDIGKGAPMACAMVYWGKNYSKFFDIFCGFGAVVDIRSLNERKSQKWQI